MMNEMKFGNLKRVNKPTARKMFHDGYTLTLCPCKMRPDSPWGVGSIINKETADNTFDRLVNAFEWYNCGAETGYYASYYVEEVN